MTFGARLKDLRKSAGMTQEQLANRLSVTPQAVSRWENNTAMPDISQLIPLANLFQVTTDCLLGVDIANNGAHIQKVIDGEFQFNLNSENPFEDKIDEFRFEIRNHPDVVGLKEKLVELLILKTEIGVIDPDPAELRELSSLCEDILVDGGGERGEAYYRSRLLELAIKLKNNSLASKLLQGVSKMRDCYEVWLPGTLIGSEKVTANKDLLYYCINYALQAVYELFGEELTAQETEELYRVEKLLEAIYTNDNTARYTEIKYLYMPIHAAMKVGEFEKVYEKLNRILEDFRLRRDQRPEFSALISKRYQLHSMYTGYLFYSIHNEARKLFQFIQRDFPEDILKTDRMKLIMDELHGFMKNDTGMEKIAGREAYEEIYNAKPLYDLE